MVLLFHATGAQLLHPCAARLLLLRLAAVDHDYQRYLLSAGGQRDRGEH